MIPTQRTKARAFAIWRYANPRDWNVTYDEIVEATGMKYHDVANTIHKMGWAGRINRSRSNVIGGTVSAEYGYNYKIPNLTQIFRNTDLTSAQEFGMDWS